MRACQRLARFSQAKQAAEMHDPLWAKGGGAGGHSAAAAKSSRSGEATPSHQQRSTMSTPASVRSGGGHTPRSSVSATSLGARVSPGGKQGTAALSCWAAGDC